MDDSITDPVAFDNRLTSKASVLPAVALLATMLLCYGVGVWIFRNKTIGGLSWVLPFLTASALGVYLYQRQCLSVGVLSDRESWHLGRNMSAWTALAVVPAYGLAQKSFGDGIVSLVMGLPMFGLILFGGIFVVKTMLLMQDHVERGRDEQLGAEEIAKMQADFRRHRGIHNMPEPARAAFAAPAALIPAMPLATSIAALPDIAKPVFKPQPLPLPKAAPEKRLNSQQDDDEIRKKVLEVRLQALKAQRKADKAAAQMQRLGSH